MTTLTAARAAVIFVFGAGLALAAVSQGADGKRRITVGPVTYSIPREAKPGHLDGEDSLFMQFALPDYGPLGRDVPGWDDNVNLLLRPFQTKHGVLFSIAQRYEQEWDGTPVNEFSGLNVIEKTYRIEPGFTVQEMGFGFDIVIPDQDRSTMPLGVMRCGRPKEFMPNAACALMFDRDGQRWKVSFGRQFMALHGEIRARVEAIMDGWRIAEGDGE